jgi:hypothetical protein
MGFDLLGTVGSGVNKAVGGTVGWAEQQWTQRIVQVSVYAAILFFVLSSFDLIGIVDKQVTKMLGMKIGTDGTRALHALTFGLFLYIGIVFILDPFVKRVANGQVVEGQGDFGTAASDDGGDDDGWVAGAGGQSAPPSKQTKCSDVDPTPCDPNSALPFFKEGGTCDTDVTDDCKTKCCGVWGDPPPALDLPHAGEAPEPIQHVDFIPKARSPKKRICSLDGWVTENPVAANDDIRGNDNFYNVISNEPLEDNTPKGNIVCKDVVTPVVSNKETNCAPYWVENKAANYGCDQDMVKHYGNQHQRDFKRCGGNLTPCKELCCKKKSQGKPTQGKISGAKHCGDLDGQMTCSTDDACTWVKDKMGGYCGAKGK